MSGTQRKAAFLAADDGAHLEWFGERLRYLVVGEQTESQFAVCIMTIRPGGETAPRNRHHEHIGLFVLAGTLTARIGSRTITLEPGSALDIAPGSARQLLNAGTVPVELLLIAAPAGFDELQFRTGIPLTSATDEVPSPTAEDRSTLLSLAAGYGLEFETGQSAFLTEPAIRLTLPGEGERIALVGDVYRFLASSNDTSGRYALLHATIPPGGGPPLHSHSREDEAFFVLKGELTFEADGAIERVAEGGFVHLPTGTRHRFANKSATPAEVLIILAPAGLELMFESVGHSLQPDEQPPDAPDPTEIERLVEAAPKYGVELFLG